MSNEAIEAEYYEMLDQFGDEVCAVCKNADGEGCLACEFTGSEGIRMCGKAPDEADND